MGNVTFLPCFLATVPPVVFVMVTHVTDKIDIATVVSTELIEAVVLRMVYFRVVRITLMPFSD